MPEQFSLTDLVPPPSCRSSVLEKIPGNIRDVIDRAIVEHDPPGYRDFYRQWKLKKYGVSFTAFYMYARQLRGRAAVIQLREVFEKPDENFSERLPDLVAQRITEHLAFADAAKPLDLHRLLVCYRTALDAVRRSRAAAAEAERAAIEERKRRTPSAPWGRKDDGTPYTQIEYLEKLHEAVADIYGFDMKTGEEVFRPTRENPFPPGAHGKGNSEAQAAKGEVRREAPGQTWPSPTDPAYVPMEPAPPQSNTTG